MRRSTHILHSLVCLLTNMFVIVKDCDSCSIQLGVISGVVIIRDCTNVTLSVCCGRLLVLCDLFSPVIRRSSDNIVLYMYTPTNPIFINTDPTHCVVAPYNIPRRRILSQLQKADLEGRNCWNIGLDENTCHFACALLPPEQFSLCVGAGLSEDLELPILPTEYEEKMQKALKSLVVFCVCNKFKRLQVHFGDVSSRQQLSLQIHHAQSF